MVHMTLKGYIAVKNDDDEAGGLGKLLFPAVKCTMDLPNGQLNP